MRRALLTMALAAPLCVPLACDFEKTGNQLAARKVMVATLLSVPPVEISPSAWLEWDGGARPDGGFPADAGLTADGGGLTVKGQTAAFVFFGERSGDTLDAVPTGISGAQVTAGAVSDARTTLKDDGSGSYTVSSVEQPALAYAAGKPYDFVAAFQGQTFVGGVDQAPSSERIGSFHPPKGYVEQPQGAPLTFTRPEPAAGQERTLGFVTVFPVGGDGQQGEPTYTSVPKAPIDFLKLVALPAEWKKTQVTVPGTAFPNAAQTYLVVFQAVRTGGPKSDNLFAGSAILVGAADVAVVRTR